MQHPSGACLKAPTLSPRAWENIDHACDNGHTWKAAMYPVSGKIAWNYVNNKEKFCPICKAFRSEEETI